jgi:hypothetical protein
LRHLKIQTINIRNEQNHKYALEPIPGGANLMLFMEGF